MKTFAILLLTLLLSGCERTTYPLLDLKYSVTPRQVSVPSLGTSLPFYFWHFALQEASPEATYEIRLELRRPNQKTEILCNFTPEYLANRAGRDLIISVIRPEPDSDTGSTDNRFQMRLLDASGEVTAMVINNNNCPGSTLRSYLNSPFVFSESKEQREKNSNAVMLWEIAKDRNSPTGQVVLVADRK